MYGPVRTVVWEGRSREAPPYPDLPLMQRAGNDFRRVVHFGLMKNGKPSNSNNA